MSIVVGNLRQGFSLFHFLRNYVRLKAEGRH